jgi:hypothetical protein
VEIPPRFLIRYIGFKKEHYGRDSFSKSSTALENYVSNSPHVLDVAGFEEGCDDWLASEVFAMAFNKVISLIVDAEMYGMYGT